MKDSTTAKRATILVAEDDSLILKTVLAFLKREDYSIISSVDGRDAVDKIAQYRPDLIITDIMMPYLSGLEIVGKVKQSDNPVPVIVSSSMAQKSVVDEAKKLGADAVLSKPYNIKQLLSCVSSLL